MKSQYWTISRRIITGFTTLILITMALGTFALWRIEGLRLNIEDLVGNALPSVVLLGECDSQTRLFVNIFNEFYINYSSDAIRAQKEAQMQKLHSHHDELF